MGTGQDVRRRFSTLVAALSMTSVAMHPSLSATAGATAGSSDLGVDTMRNLTHAARTESAAYLQYSAYADMLPASRAGLAGVWRKAAEDEYEHHWVQAARRSGLISDVPADNLKSLITAYRQAITAGEGFAARAPEGPAATELRAVVDRHRSGLALLEKALAAMGGTGRMPEPPQAQAIALQESARPRYSGEFYTRDLTGDADSAMSNVAWNWALDEAATRVAMRTGQTALGRLLSGLRDQERRENWPALANAAGFINGPADNLKASIAGERRAIDMYGRFAGEATAAGDSDVASLMSGYRADEQEHLDDFTAELKKPGG